MEENLPIFPLNGNFFARFSIQWKFFGSIFHSMENAGSAAFLKRDKNRAAD